MEVPPISFLPIPLSPICPLPRSFLKEALDKAAPLELSSSAWGYTPSYVPLLVLLAMMEQLLAMLMIFT